jgi:hypothetical protein
MKNNGLFCFGFFLSALGLFFFWMDSTINSIFVIDTLYSMISMICFFFSMICFIFYCIMDDIVVHRKLELQDTTYHKWVDTQKRIGR